MEVQECLEKIQQLQNTLEQVKFTLYFQPSNAINIPGVDTMDNVAVEIQGLISLISNTPPLTPS